MIDRDTKQLRFHVWYPGCPMEDDAYGIPKPKDTAAFEPQLLLVPCVGFGPKGLRLGYGGGFYDRTLATLRPRPFTVGRGFCPRLRALAVPEPHDVPLDAMLVEDGVVYQRALTRRRRGLQPGLPPRPRRWHNSSVSADWFSV